MSQNPLLAAEIAPLPAHGRPSFVHNHVLPFKLDPATVLPPTTTLHSLLMGNGSKGDSQGTTVNGSSSIQGFIPNEKTAKAKCRTISTSNASDVATEASSVTRESSTPKEDGLVELRPNGELPKSNLTRSSSHGSGGTRLNKFVKRLHDMLQAEKEGGVIEWRRGLLVLHSTADFAKNILPRYFNTRNFKTFRRQLNYYGFVHVRSFSTAAASTTALWVNQELAESGSAEIAAVLTLKRVEPCELQKTAEGRRQRKEMAMHTVEEDLKIDPKTLQLEQIQNLARKESRLPLPSLDPKLLPTIPFEIAFPYATTAGGTSFPFRQSPMTENVVSDDMRSSSSASSSVDARGSDTSDDSMGAANLLLLLSRSGC